MTARDRPAPGRCPAWPQSADRPAGSPCPGRPASRSPSCRVPAHPPRRGARPQSALAKPERQIGIVAVGRRARPAGGFAAGPLGHRLLLEARRPDQRPAEPCRAIEPRDRRPSLAPASLADESRAPVTSRVPPSGFGQSCRRPAPRRPSKDRADGAEDRASAAPPPAEVSSPSSGPFGKAIDAGNLAPPARHQRRQRHRRLLVGMDEGIGDEDGVGMCWGRHRAL